MGANPAVLGPLEGGHLRAPSIARAADAAVLPVAIGLLSFATVGQGAFYRPQGSFLAAALGALALASSTSLAGLGPLVAGGAVLLVGVSTSGLANGWGANTPQIVAALGSAVAIVPVVRRVIARGERAHLLQAVSWLGAGVALVGIAGVALHEAPWALRAGGLWRASSTLTYANAAGSLLLLALGASILLLADRSTTARRLAAFLTLAGLGATLSRGAVVGAIAALAVLAALGGLGLLRSVLRPAAGALIALGALVPSIAGGPRPALGIAGLLVGAAVAAGQGRVARGRGRIAIVVVAAGAVAAGGLVASAGASRVFEQRALPASETRLHTWHNTWRLALENPVLGYGPGTFSIVEEDPSKGPVLIRYVHNEYLQALFETGVVGLATLGGALAILASWAWRRRRDDGGHWAMACAACTAFAAHSAFDFLWRLPVLVALAFLWLAVAVTPPPETATPTSEKGEQT